MIRNEIFYIFSMISKKKREAHNFNVTRFAF